MIETFFNYTSKKGSEKFLEIVENFLVASKLNSAQAVQLYNLLETTAFQLPEIPELEETRNIINLFLRDFSLIRMHFYIEARVKEGINERFESRLKTFLDFLETGRVVDLAQFKPFGRSQRFATFISLIMNISIEKRSKAIENYRRFLIARIITERERFAFLDIRIQINNCRLLLAALPDTPAYTNQRTQAQRYLQENCRQHAAALQANLAMNYGSALQELTWLAGFSPEAEQLMAKRIASNQPYVLPYFSWLFYKLPTELEQKQMTTRHLWNAYAKVKENGGDERDAEKQLCEWFNQHCVTLRQNSKSAVCDAINDALQALVEAPFEDNIFFGIKKVLVDHIELTDQLIEIITNLKPELKSLYKTLSDKIKEMKAYVMEAPEISM